MSWYPNANLRKWRFGWLDVVLLLFVAAMLFAFVSIGTAVSTPVATWPTNISLNPWTLPYDIFRSLLRIFVAFFLSLLFSVAYGYAAARSRTLARVLIPLLDILQSVPVLGFLAVSMTALDRLFPHSLIGFELSAIFAIFSAQAWNMTFSFYHSLQTVPRDLSEATLVYRLTGWQRLLHLELPVSTISLALNAMMSFGGSWFFLAASEAVAFHGKTVLLPGIGAYIYQAERTGNVAAILWALVTLAAVILLVDQLFWRPVMAWAQRFKLENVPSESASTSALLTRFRRSVVMQFIRDHLIDPFVAWSERVSTEWTHRRGRRRGKGGLVRVWGWLLLVAALAVAVRFALQGTETVASLGWLNILQAARLGVFTLGRVLLAVVLGAAWTVPVGVWIGLNPRLTRLGQQLAQLASSFPANVFFPFLAVWFIRAGLGLNIGAVFLMMLATQWYILFNVLAGTIAIPQDLKETARIFGLRGWEWWRSLVLPAIFPSLITGGITAAGGAWNASIVAELVPWHHQQLSTSGIGAYITQATQLGETGKLVLGIVVMSVLVVCTNRLLWQPLYRLAELKFHVE